MSSDQSMFDDYLDACLRGEAPQPDTFLAEYPDASAEVRGKIRQMYSAAASAAEADLPFEHLGDYRLLHRLDAGGMGAVYVAEQTSLDRVVALKLMRPEWAANEEAVRFFEREVHAVAQLRHPGIVTIFDAGSQGDTRYLAMEMVPGRMLSDLLAEAALDGERIPVDRIVRWGVELARALDYAHTRGIVHRDVKPENIRITPDDKPMLLDFGIAVDLTGNATFVSEKFQGSPAYAAPEQITNDKIDARTDIYGLGVTLYQALTGAVPFSAPTIEGIFNRVLNEAPRTPREFQRAVSADLETVVLKAMEKRPSDRYDSAGAFGDDLEAVLTFRPVSARPPGPVARAVKWARRRPAYAVAIASALIFVVVFGALALVQQAARARDQRSEARALVARAREAVTQYRTERLEAHQEETDVGVYRKDMRDRYFTPAEDQEFRALEASVESRARTRDRLFHEVLTTLRRAEQLDANLEGTDEVRAALYIEKYEEAKTARDPVRQAFFRHQAELHDRGGHALQQFAKIGTLRVGLTNPDAKAWVFAFREHREVVSGEGRRLVPVPVGATAPPPVPYGTIMLRVVRGAGDLHQGDLILSLLGQPVSSTLFVRSTTGVLERLEAVDGTEIFGAADLEEALMEPAPHVFTIAGQARRGATLAELDLHAVEPATVADRGGVQAVVVSNGVKRDSVLPEGLVTRLTATPLFPADEARVGPQPRQLPVGNYLVLLRASGCEEVRIAADVKADALASIAPVLSPLGTTPLGFVRVPKDRHGEAFHIMEHEVTCAQYAAFLHDEEISRTIVDGQRSLVPRGPHGESLWERVDGQLTYTPPDWLPDTPVMGLNFHDAQRYAAWRSKREGVTYALPSEIQWNRATGHWTFARTYTYGNVFFPKWVSSNWARPRARPEPWTRYPVDESPFGVYSTSGGAMEWLEAWWDKAKTQRWLAGGAWGYADPVLFRSPGGWGNKPERSTGTYGFRLVRTP